MRATTVLLTSVFALWGTASFAQSNYNIVVEPVGPTVDSIIHAPIEYDDHGVVKVQHYNVDNLTDEEYQQVLDEAARIRAYRTANGLNFESEYVTPEYNASGSDTYGAVSTPVSDRGTNYQIELFAPETSYATSSYTTSSYSENAHTVSKGENLFRISKLYDVTVAEIQAENAMSNTDISVGQQIRIPSAFIENASVTSRPLYSNSTPGTGYITNHVVEPVPVWQSSGVETSNSSEKVYGVLKKDTLSSISRRTCVSVKDIISRNGITNPDVLTPGMYITLPAGHCLAR